MNRVDTHDTANFSPIRVKAPGGGIGLKAAAKQVHLNRITQHEAPQTKISFDGFAKGIQQVMALQHHISQAISRDPVRSPESDARHRERLELMIESLSILESNLDRIEPDSPMHETEIAFNINTTRTILNQEIARLTALANNEPEAETSRKDFSDRRFEYEKDLLFSNDTLRDCIAVVSPEQYAEINANLPMSTFVDRSGFQGLDLANNDAAQRAAKNFRQARDDFEAALVEPETNSETLNAAARNLELSFIFLETVNPSSINTEHRQVVETALQSASDELEVRSQSGQGDPWSENYASNLRQIKLNTLVL
ncbi:MAG: hypothetical protein OXU45_01915 [Candidatus Melainabacteria bacterium]|nr:hypothetical protein [Candidatus Melainabacteria bacterium]